MHSCGFTVGAQIIIRTFQAFESCTFNFPIAPVTHNIRVKLVAIGNILDALQI
jgi:hypothetical protein